MYIVFLTILEAFFVHNCPLWVCEGQLWYGVVVGAVLPGDYPLFLPPPEGYCYVQKLCQTAPGDKMSHYIML